MSHGGAEGTEDC